MHLTVNGTEETVPDGVSVTQLLELRKVSMPDMVSVERNGAILDRATFPATILKDGDRIEFLYFMGGGFR